MYALSLDVTSSLFRLLFVSILASDWPQVSRLRHVMTMTGNNMEPGHDTDSQEVGIISFISFFISYVRIYMYMILSM